MYPMNALANSQEEELKKFLANGYPDGQGAGDVPSLHGPGDGRAAGGDPPAPAGHPADQLRDARVHPDPPVRGALVKAAQDLSFLVLDELHTYRGRQGSDVALLVRRVRDATNATNLRCVGTSATLAGPGTFAEQRAEVARVATRLFGAAVDPGNVIGETLRPATDEVDVTDAGFSMRLQRGSRSRAAPSTLRGDGQRPACAVDRADPRDRLRPRGRTLRALPPRPITGERGRGEAPCRGHRP